MQALLLSSGFAHVSLWLARGVAALTVASMVYWLLALATGIGFRGYQRRWNRLAEGLGGPLDETLPGVTSLPGVTMMKAIKGADPEMMEAFRSHCRQRYAGAFELIFATHSEDDEAVPMVRQLMTEFPAIAIRLVVCPERLGTNGKISNLAQAVGEARHPYLVINDSDIRVSERYLMRVMAQFLMAEAGQTGQRPVGMVTALYRGRAHGGQGRHGKHGTDGAHGAHGTLGSLLEALGIATDFQAGVMVSRIVERGMHFGLGSTLAVRREALAAAGGLEALVDQLADDYEMGVRIDRAGWAVRLMSEVVETSVPAYDWRGYWSHQMRWARTVRDSRRAGYIGLGVTHLIPLALATVVASGASLASLWLLVLAVCLRAAAAMQVGALVAGDHQVLPWLWLLPLRDCVGFAVWVWSFAGNTIEWRGERFELRDGRLLRKEG